MRSLLESPQRKAARAMTGNGIPARVMGQGEGFTTLILTDAESRLIRKVLTESADMNGAAEAFNRGIRRATERIAAEFKLEQEQRKALKSDQAATVQKGKR